MTIVKYYMMDVLLALEPINWNKRYKDKLSESLGEKEKKKVSWPKDPKKPSRPFEELQGSYQNPAYGLIEVCILGPETCHPITLDPEIKAVLTWADEIPTKSMTRLIVKPDKKLFCSYMLFSHYDGDTFKVSILMVQETQSTGTGYAVYVMEDDLVGQMTFGGIALMGNFWGASQDGARVPTDVAKGEVWFQRQ